MRSKNRVQETRQKGPEANITCRRGSRERAGDGEPDLAVDERDVEVAYAQEGGVDGSHGRPAGVVEVVEEELRWWTFAGGRINATLRYALEALNPGWKIIPDNFMLKIRGEVDRERFRVVREQLEDPATSRAATSSAWSASASALALALSRVITPRGGAAPISSGERSLMGSPRE